MQDDVVALFAYDRWANRKVLDACRKLTAEFSTNYALGVVGEAIVVLKLKTTQKRPVRLSILRGQGNREPHIGSPCSMADKMRVTSLMGSPLVAMH